MSSVARSHVVLALLVWSGACDFEGIADVVIEVNTCVADSECAADAHCEGGMCVARSVDDPLEVALEVAPLGTAATTIVLERFDIKGATMRTWELPPPVTVSGSIRDGDDHIGAEVRFVPAHGLSGVAAVPVVASTVDAIPALEDADYEVELLEGVTYRMEVQPVARDLPPVRKEVTVMAGEPIDVDYATMHLGADVFSVKNGPPGEVVLVRAVDPLTGALVSSTAAVMEEGRATLLLAPDAGPYRLELLVEERYEETVLPRADVVDCDTSAPVYPVFAIDASDVEDGVIKLPADYPQRIQYSGTVELCPGAKESLEAIGNLPITLRSTEIAVERGDAAFSGIFSATTAAEFDGDKLRFCVEVVPGTYEVVVTPPSSMECAIFAESRVVEASDAEATALLLPPPAYLTGTLQTADGSPVPGATIEAQALGRTEGVDLAADDASVTSYNRSKQTTSSEDGSFEVPVDLGGYDILVKPPAESGFPWRILHDVNVDARDVDFDSIIEVVSPVRIDGTLDYTGTGAPKVSTLAGAEVRAFAIIKDEFDTERAVPIGKAVVDDEGLFMLLLPPSTHKGL